MRIIGRSDRVIKPGKNDEIKVSITTSFKYGEFSRHIQVTTNDPNNEVVRLEGKGKVLVPINVKPRALNMGNIDPESTVSKASVKLLRGDGGPIKPELSDLGKPNIEAKIEEVRPGEEYNLTVTATPPWPAKPIRLRPSLKTGVKEMPNQSLSLYIGVAPPIKVIPNRVLFRKGLDEAQPRTVRIQWRGKQFFRITNVELGDANLDVTIVNEGTPAQRLVITAPANYNPSYERNTLTIYTEDPENPTIKVPLQFLKPLPKAKTIKTKRG